MSARTCEVDGCSKEHTARGMCAMHYSRWHKKQPKKVRPKYVNCVKCNERIALGSKGPITKLCASCKRQKQYKSDVRKDPLTNHRRVLLKYGLTADDYRKLVQAHDGRCAICDSPPDSGNNAKYGRLSLDHDHISGHVRGLLCAQCNFGLGHFKDDTYRLKRAIEYLTFWPTTRMAIGQQVRPL